MRASFGPFVLLLLLSGCECGSSERDEAPQTRVEGVGVGVRGERAREPHELVRQIAWGARGVAQEAERALSQACGGGGHHRG